MKYLTLILLFLFIFAYCSFSAPVPEPFFKALHQVETSGRLGPIRGSAGELGPFQIRMAYWKDSGVKGSFPQCSDLTYSKRVVEAYLNRYCPKAVQAHDYEQMARVHNGGPAGMKVSSTVGYWRKVQKVLYR